MAFRAGRKHQNTVSMHDPIESERDGSMLTLNDVVADTFEMETACEDREEVRRLRRVVEGLAGRDRQIIVLRYGLSGEAPLTQQQVAELLHISRSYISRLEKRAVEQLREQLALHEGEN